MSMSINFLTLKFTKENSLDHIVFYFPTRYRKGSIYLNKISCFYHIRIIFRRIYHLRLDEKTIFKFTLSPSFSWYSIFVVSFTMIRNDSSMNTNNSFFGRSPFFCTKASRWMIEKNQTFNNRYLQSTAIFLKTSLWISSIYGYYIPGEIDIIDFQTISCVPRFNEYMYILRLFTYK